MMAISFLLPFWKAYLTQRYQEDPGRMFDMTVLTTVSSIIASLWWFFSFILFDMVVSLVWRAYIGCGDVS